MVQQFSKVHCKYVPKKRPQSCTQPWECLNRNTIFKKRLAAFSKGILSTPRVNIYVHKIMPNSPNQLSVQRKMHSGIVRSMLDRPAQKGQSAHKRSLQRTRHDRRRQV